MFPAHLPSRLWWQGKDRKSNASTAWHLGQPLATSWLCQLTQRFLKAVSPCYSSQGTCSSPPARTLEARTLIVLLILGAYGSVLEQPRHSKAKNNQPSDWSLLLQVPTEIVQTTPGSLEADDPRSHDPLSSLHL